MSEIQKRNKIVLSDEQINDLVYEEEQRHETMTTLRYIIYIYIYFLLYKISQKNNLRFSTHFPILSKSLPNILK